MVDIHMHVYITIHNRLPRPPGSCTWLQQPALLHSKYLPTPSLLLLDHLVMDRQILIT